MNGTTRQRLALIVSAAGAMLVALDGTVLMVAQPSVQHDLGASVAQTQWTSTGYLLAVAALLVIAGRLGDRYGHRRMLLGGLLGFAGSRPPSRSRRTSAG
ncbi:MFS transporter [Nonomuraea sp. NPDC050451]|uniref:MFS transporter n=1 Tax=Nonomuraea sp. NPDC050451 TaxID=3364364 RepID=UPI0037A587BC